MPPALLRLLMPVLAWCKAGEGVLGCAGQPSGGCASGPDEVSERRGVPSRAAGSLRTLHRPHDCRHHHTPPSACRGQTRLTRAAVMGTRSCASPSVRSRQILAGEVPGSSRVHGTIAESVSRLPTRVAPEATSVGNAGSWPGLTSVPGWVSPRHPRGVF
jgi:hypothetical protein